MAVDPTGERHEDEPLLRGTGTFAADLRLPGQVYLRVVRSPIAHGVLTGVDRDAAAGMDGVLAVWTAEDVAADLGGIPKISARLSGSHADPFLQPVLAHERVRYVGEPVAVVVATDAYRAEDAAELVFAEIDPLPVVTDLRGAPTADGLFPEGNEAVTMTVRFGPVDEAFADAVVVGSEFSIGRQAALPIETRGLVVDYQTDEGTVVVHGATKVPHWNRAELARQLGIPPERIRMRETDIGGGFGVRGEFYPEDCLTAWAAMQLERPVAWVEDRREHFVATNHAREQIQVASLAGDADGRILGLRTEIWCDLGAYVRTNGLRVPENTVSWMPGPYDIEAYDGVAHCVLTNHSPTGTYRAPGGAESTFVRERLIDMYAARIGADPLEVRRRNLIKKSSMPYTRASVPDAPPTIMDEGDFERIFDVVMSSVDTGDVERRRASGERVGLGVGLFIERAGSGPWERGAVRVLPDGSVAVWSGASSVGQGIRTTLAQIASDVLRVPHSCVHVENLDTSRTPEGIGSFASRSTVMAGSAVHLAAEAVVERAKEVAASVLGVRPEELELEASGTLVHPTSGRLTLAEVASELASRDGGEGLSAERAFRKERPSYDFGMHAAVVSVDPETGAPAIERIVVGFDVGTMINPHIVRGQLYGAAVQGVGGALLEVLRYTDDGDPLVTSLMDYLVPTAAEVPEIVVIPYDDEPSDSNPLGVKGAGEGGITGVAAAVAGAVCSAVGDAGRITSTPIDAGALITDPEEIGASER